MSGLRGRVYAKSTIENLRSVNTSAHSYVELVQATAPRTNQPGQVIVDNLASKTTPAPSITPTSPTSATTSGNTSVLISGTGFLAGAGTVDVVEPGTDLLSDGFTYSLAETITRSFEETIVGL